MMRYALVSLVGTTAVQIAAYLPANYELRGFVPHDPEADGTDPRYVGPCVLIEGRDSHGWTLDGYVIPRLQSGMHVIREIDLSHPAMKQIAERPSSVPEDAKLLEMPYSEVCCHMRVAGKMMWAAPVDRGMAQLYELDGRKFSMPITRGEAGLR
jgi:hypothetical protein